MNLIKTQEKILSFTSNLRKFQSLDATGNLLTGVKSKSIHNCMQSSCDWWEFEGGKKENGMTGSL